MKAALRSVADKMFESNGPPRAQFLDLVSKDTVFAADPQARLQWLLDRSD